MLKWLNSGRVLALAALAAVALLLIISLCNLLITRTAKPYLYSDINRIPAHKVAVVLGTSRYTSDGDFNWHYRRRMEAAAALIKEEKIGYVLVSGDNGTRWYDEPTRMKRDLITLGVPAERIYRDYAGFRTLDSIIRAKEVFGLDTFIIISQQFQNERALYIARKNNIDAIAYNARGILIPEDYSNRIREALARVLAVIETHILGTGPRVLGPDIIIGETPPT
ncbi:SanA/YdcF family protein [Parendozoicomonas haliclonae]|uniref:Vancomycin high temperature exclusion protein n=1 Tax=Parendozoicomonas haliclonae TaxID=1960125 RepID=A0A1X7APJ7_9GAMM|nr:ElyC/SanA/YdcF family protein [Parendozoicomonas haliclonae]SMA50009.1 vancomycin high temperature exclusion protein [Parendozoicomonas haliclonae]